MLPSKSSIQESFEKASGSYHQIATIQQTVAQELAQSIAQTISMPIYSWLDLGCGTGFLSQSLLTHFPEAEISLNDLSPSMLGIAQELLKKRSPTTSIRSIAGDFENMGTSDSYDLIASNFVWQWLEDPLNTIQRLLPQTSLLALSFPIQGSLHEWETLHQRLRIPSRLYPLPTLEQIHSWKKCIDASIIEMTQKEYQQSFKNPLDFAQNLKKMGANPQNKSSINHSLKTIYKKFPQPLSVTWRVAFMMIKN